VGVEAASTDARQVSVMRLECDAHVCRECDSYKIVACEGVCRAPPPIPPPPKLPSAVPPRRPLFGGGGVRCEEGEKPLERAVMKEALAEYERRSYSVVLAYLFVECC
jgi:hypothetical protein